MKAMTVYILVLLINITLTLQTCYFQPIRITNLGLYRVLFDKTALLLSNYSTNILSLTLLK